MEVYMNSWLQTGKHFFEDVLNIAPDLHHVRGIDEQDVATPKLTKPINGHVLKSARYYLDPRRISGFKQCQEPVRIRLYEGAADIAAEEAVAGVERDAGRIPGADFDDRSRPKMPEHEV